MTSLPRLTPMPLLQSRASRLVALCSGLLLAACGGSGGGGDSTVPTTSSTDSSGSVSPSLTLLQQWDFQSAQGWQLSGAPSATTSATLGSGLLSLQSAMSVSASGELQCPVVAAEVALSDARLLAGSLSLLAIDMTVSRWDLGLGRFDTDVPRLELVYAGQRHVWGVSGFGAMPGNYHLQGHPASGWAARYNGVAAPSATPTVSSDSSAPLLRLWIDGCSAGMSQRLDITALSISGA